VLWKEVLDPIPNSKSKKEVNKMVEFDEIKQSLANFAQPLLEMGDSL
jgi:hypothetical protein